jgi:hypothetical protein
VQLSSSFYSHISIDRQNYFTLIKTPFHIEIEKKNNPTKHFVNFHGKNPWQIFQENLRNCTISTIKKQIKLIISNLRFRAVKTQRIKKRDKTCYPKKLQNFKKKPYRIGYNPIKPVNFFQIFISRRRQYVFSRCLRPGWPIIGCWREFLLRLTDGREIILVLMTQNQQAGGLLSSLGFRPNGIRPFSIISSHSFGKLQPLLYGLVRAG